MHFVALVIMISSEKYKSKLFDFSNEIVLQTEIELLGFTPEIKSFTHVNLSTESIIIMNIYPKW